LKRTEVEEKEARLVQQPNRKFLSLLAPAMEVLVVRSLGMDEIAILYTRRTNFCAQSNEGIKKLRVFLSHKSERRSFIQQNDEPQHVSAVMRARQNIRMKKEEKSFNSAQ